MRRQRYTNGRLFLGGIIRFAVLSVSAGYGINVDYMTIPKIEERTFYPPIINYLQIIGFSAIGNTIVTKKEPDILFKLNDISFVIEVKLDKVERVLTEAVGQAYDYGRRLGTTNVIVLVYPERLRNASLANFDIIDRLALEEKVSAFVFTEYWTQGLVIEPSKLFNLLKEKIEAKQVQVDFGTTVKLIETYAKELNSVVYEIRTDELVAEVVDKLDLFSSIGEIKDKDTAKKQVINLASYLLFNQLLFYHIYKRRVKDNNSLPELNEIENVNDIQKYFDKITKIDYRSIYKVNILSHIPNKKPVIETLNNVLKAIKLLRAEYITHDLAGRFFHDLIPYEVRKVLAAFYTHPISADILAGLTIGSWEDTVIDPACGSGTLLVASYRRKEKLFREKFKDGDENHMHKRFIENDITGIDIMPFASHMSAINLTTQNIQQKTNTVRIATQDSLELSSALSSTQFKRKGIEISPYTTSIQLTLDDTTKGAKKRHKGAISTEGKGSSFYIDPLDVVIMNPPFTDRDKMTEEMRQKLKDNTELNKTCGNAVNFWGYFLALNDLLLKPNGRCGAVIPINIARGTSTEKIRKFLLENYHIEYIIKPIGDFAFSESSSFKDILFIAQKRKPNKEDLTTVVFIKKSVRELTYPDSETIIELIKNTKVKEGEIYEDDYLQLKKLSQSELYYNINNLMTIIGGTSFENIDTLRTFIDKSIRYGRYKLFNFDLDTLREGITSPSGLGQLVYITVPTHEARTGRSFLILQDKTKNDFLVMPKDSKMEIKVPNSVTKPALRTLTGIETIDIADNSDYIINKEYDDFKKVLMLSKWKGKFDWDIINTKIRRIGESRLVIPDKIRLSSKNTIMLAAYSGRPLILSNLFFAYRNLDENICKTLALSLNSIITLSQFLMLKSETLGGYIRLSANDWILTYQLDYNKLDEDEKKAALKLFEKIKSIKFPSIVEQLEDGFSGRKEIDKFILHTLGFSDKEIEQTIAKVYSALIKEFKAEKASESRE